MLYKHLKQLKQLKQTNSVREKPTLTHKSPTGLLVSFFASLGRKIGVGDSTPPEWARFQ